MMHRARQVKIGVRLGVCALICFLFLLSTAVAATITFDDLPYEGYSGSIPDGYSGLNWHDFAIEFNSLFPPTGPGYTSGVISAPNVAFNFGLDGPASFSKTSPFTLNSAYLTGAWNDNLGITVTGYLNGTQIATKSITVNSTSPSFVNFNWTNINEVDFTSGGGIPNPCCVTLGAGGNFAIDNVSIDEQQSMSRCTADLAGAVHVYTGGLSALFAQPTEMDALFAPTVGLAQAALDCGVTKFDWQQTIDHLPAPSFLMAASTGSSLTAPPSFYDPVAGGYTYEITCPNGMNSVSYRDAAPFYYDLNGPSTDCMSEAAKEILYTSTGQTALTFFDAPQDPALLLLVDRL